MSRARSNPSPACHVAVRNRDRIRHVARAEFRVALVPDQRGEGDAFHSEPRRLSQGHPADALHPFERQRLLVAQADQEEGFRLDGAFRRDQQQGLELVPGEFPRLRSEAMTPPSFLSSSTAAPRVVSPASLCLK